MSEAKRALRSKYKTLRATVADREDGEKSLAANLNQLMDQVLNQNAARSESVQNWGAYLAIPGEVDLGKFLKLRQDVQWCFPRIVDHKLEMWRPRLITDVKPGAFGILEPGDGSHLVPPQQLEGLLIPLVAFDQKGYRLGSGKGFYDRYLQGFNGRTIGIAFECQKHSQALPIEPHDQPVDFVVTEDKVYQARNV